MAEKESFTDYFKRLMKFPSKLKSAAQNTQELLKALMRGKLPEPSEPEPDTKKPGTKEPESKDTATKKPKKEVYKRIKTLEPNHIGKLIFYDYDPKWKKKLPYYDRFPLVIPISIQSDRFIGINLHYLAPGYRAALFDAIYRNVYKRKNITEEEIVKLNYSMLSNISKSKLFIPCVKQYLYSHVGGGYTLIPSSEWKAYIPRSIPKFEKKSKEYVWRDSLRKINKS